MLTQSLAPLRGVYLRWEESGSGIVPLPAVDAVPLHGGPLVPLKVPARGHSLPAVNLPCRCEMGPEAVEGLKGAGCRGGCL